MLASGPELIRQATSHQVSDMGKNLKTPRQVYAIIRIDHYHASNTPLDHLFVVKEIVSNIEIAQREVKRLNHLNPDGKVTYCWQMTRLYSEGESAGGSLK